MPGHDTFLVSAKSVADRLISANVSANVSATSKLVNEAGKIVSAESIGRGKIQLYGHVFGVDGKATGAKLAKAQRVTIVHEGIHFTGYGPSPQGRTCFGELSVFDPGELGWGAERLSHRVPFNAAARQMLAP